MLAEVKVDHFNLRIKLLELFLPLILGVSHSVISRFWLFVSFKPINVVLLRTAAQEPTLKSVLPQLL